MEACRLQAMSQVERYGKTLASGLQLYVTNNQQNLDIFIQPLTYAYNCQPHLFINFSAFSLTLTRRPPGQVTIDRQTVLPTDAVAVTAANALRVLVLVQLATLSLMVSSNLRQNRYGYKNVFTAVFGRCLNFLLDN